MNAFEYNANPGRVVFGSGSQKKLPDEVKRQSKSKPLILCTPEQVKHATDVANILDNASIKPAGIYTKATMHTPTHITDDALDHAKECGADCVVSVGGGSTIGLGKARSGPACTTSAYPQPMLAVK